MLDDMPKPRFWVSISVEGDEHFVHVINGSMRQRIGPFSSHHEAAVAAKQEWKRAA